MTYGIDARQLFSAVALGGVVVAPTSVGVQSRLTAQALPASATPAVRTLVSELDAERASARATAACELGRLGTAAEPAIPNLVSMLDDDRPTPAIACAINRTGWGELRVSSDADLSEWPTTTPGREAARSLARLDEVRTPAMVAGLSARALSFRDIFAAPTTRRSPRCSETVGRSRSRKAARWPARQAAKGPSFEFASTGICGSPGSTRAAPP